MRTPGIEPESQPWKGCMLPLHHTRVGNHTFVGLNSAAHVVRQTIGWCGIGFFCLHPSTLTPLSPDSLEPPVMHLVEKPGLARAP